METEVSMLHSQELSDNPYPLQREQASLNTLLGNKS